MRILQITLILIFTLTGCSRSPELPKGISLRVESSGNIIIRWDKGCSVQISQNTPDYRTAIVSNSGGTFELDQFSERSMAPKSTTLPSPDRAEFSVQTHSPHTLIVDKDGDGLPDMKIDLDAHKKYRRANIEWEEIAQ